MYACVRARGKRASTEWSEGSECGREWSGVDQCGGSGVDWSGVRERVSVE